jgi:hypothetical protein
MRSESAKTVFPGERPESRLFDHLQNVWTPVFTGVTAFYEAINIVWQKPKDED